MLTNCTLGPVVLLPSGRLGRKLDGLDTEAFLDNNGYVVCKHGERASSICNWYTQPSRTRDTTCDCKTTSRLKLPLKTCSDPTCLCTTNPKLFHSFSHPKRMEVCKGELIFKPTEWPAFTPELPTAYHVLREMGREPVQASETEAKRCYAFTTTSGNDVWVRESGELVCKHGHSRQTISIDRNRPEAERIRRLDAGEACDCRIEVPRRDGGVLRLTGVKRARNDFVKGKKSASAVKTPMGWSGPW